MYETIAKAEIAKIVELRKDVVDLLTGLNVSSDLTGLPVDEDEAMYFRRIREALEAVVRAIEAN